jgi:hypothetical protein
MAYFQNRIVFFDRGNSGRMRSGDCMATGIMLISNSNKILKTILTTYPQAFNFEESKPIPKSIFFVQHYLHLSWSPMKASSKAPYLLLQFRAQQEVLVRRL